MFCFLFGRGSPRAVSYTPIFRFFGFSVLLSLRSGAPLGLFLILQSLGFLVLVFCFLFGCVGSWGRGVVGLWGRGCGVLGWWGRGVVGSWGRGVVGLWGRGVVGSVVGSWGCGVVGSLGFGVVGLWGCGVVGWAVAGFWGSWGRGWGWWGRGVVGSWGCGVVACGVGGLWGRGCGVVGSWGRGGGGVVGLVGRRGAVGPVSYTPIFRFFGFSVLFSIRSGAPLNLSLILQSLGFLVLVFCFLFGRGLP